MEQEKLMKVKITKKKSEVPEFPKEGYELIVRAMSGDGDNYENKSLRLRETDSLFKFTLCLLYGASNAIWYLNLRELEDWEGFIEKIPLELPLTETIGSETFDFDFGEWLYDVIGSDVTCHDYLAQIDSLELIYHDGNGGQAECEVEIEYPHLESIEDTDEHMTHFDYQNKVVSNCFTDDDGMGVWATKNQKMKYDPETSLLPSQYRDLSDRPVWATHVVWYNK
jgi:hypothetical protein